MGEMTGFTAGKRVRLIADPGRIGVLTGTSMVRGPRTHWQVQFPDLPHWVPASQLELLPEAPEHPLELLRLGRFSSARGLARALAHLRLSGRQADVIYSMEATTTDFHAYQFKPVLKLLRSPANAVLIADEVGLGKTIEAGLIWTELRHRFDLRRLLVVCPAALREKWCEELSRRMGVDATQVGAAELHDRIRRKSPQGFALVASLQGLRPFAGWESEGDDSAAGKLARMLQHAESEEPLIDLLVIDEAHHLRNEKTVSHEIGALLRRASSFAVLLTATPIHNRNTDLFSLFRLLDPGLLPRENDFNAVLAANRPLVRAREMLLGGKKAREVLEQLDSARRDPLLATNRQLAQLHAELAQANELDAERRSRLAYRLDTINLLGNIVNRTRKREVAEWRVVREPVPEPISPADCEREFYETVTGIVAEYATQISMNERFLLAMPQRQMTSSMAAALRCWSARNFEIHDEFAADEENASTLGPVTERIVAACTGGISFEQLRDADQKYARLREILQEQLRRHGTKVVVFSTFRATLNYLSERLAEDGIATTLLMGGSRQGKAETIAEFRAPSGPPVLLSSEVGGEGVDLQFSSLLVNYDLPWNPMRVEQRIGRIDRLGQTAPKVLIWNLFYEGTIDERIYRRLYEKLELCKEAMGDFEAILGEEMRKLTVALLGGDLTPAQQEERIAQTAQALENLRRENEALESEASTLLAHGDYVLDQIHGARAHARYVTSDDLVSYVREALNSFYVGCRITRVEADRPLYDVTLTPEAKEDLAQFIRRERMPDSTAFVSAAPVVRCWVENRVDSNRNRAAELLAQTHPLVRLLVRRVSESDRQLQPAVAVEVSSKDLANAVPGFYVLGAALWSTGGLRGDEKLVFGGRQLDPASMALSELDAERLFRKAIVQGTDLPEAASLLDLKGAATLTAQKLFAELDEQFDSWSQGITAEFADRADLQERILDDHLAQQSERLRLTLQKHEAAGRLSLVRATEGRLNALRERVERKRIALRRQRLPNPSQNDVGVIVLRVV